MKWSKPHQLPKEYEYLKHAPLYDISPYYEIYQNGEIYSRMSGKFLTKHLHQKSIGISLRRNGKLTTFSIDALYRKYIIGMPEIEGVEHKPLKNYEQYYEVYSDGRVFSKREYKFLKICTNQEKYHMFSVVNDDGRITSCYIHRAVYETFVGEIPAGYQIHHIDNNNENNSLSNLQLVDRLIHRREHYAAKRGTPRKDWKKTLIGEIKNEQ